MILRVYCDDCFVNMSVSYCEADYDDNILTVQTFDGSWCDIALDVCSNLETCMDNLYFNSRAKVYGSITWDKKK